jgi:hypothetical protein
MACAGSLGHGALNAEEASQRVAARKDAVPGLFCVLELFPPLLIYMGKRNSETI